MIVSRQLKKGVVLVRDQETLTVESVEKKGNSTVAIVNGSRGVERLTITDLWNQKVKIKEEAKAEVKSETKAPVKTKPATSITSIKRAGGIATMGINESGVVWSSWKRTH